MSKYKNKYKKYKTKYLNLRRLDDQNVVVHIAGPQGSGKTTMAKLLKTRFTDNIYVTDLDDLRNSYTANEQQTYQFFIDEYIKSHSDKPLMLVGVDANLCLGPSDIITDYNFNTKYKYYIDNPLEQTLKQRFFRQISKLCDRKEEFFNSYLNSTNKIQEKLFRYVNINEWKENTIKCNELYKQRQYIFISFDDIYQKVTDLLITLLKKK
jgi:hypothetical protein